MVITAALVKELRERTGAAMMACKKALVEAEGDIDRAIEIMRKSGDAKAVKKAGRVAAEGLISVQQSADSKKAVVLEINCETDFVARDENFKAFVSTVTQLALDENVDTVDNLLNAKADNGTVDDLRKQLIIKIGENIQIRRIAVIQSDQYVASYKHGDRIGVVLGLTTDNESLGKDIAMQIAANNPVMIKPSDADEAFVQKETQILTEQSIASGKPAAIIEKMVTGKLTKTLNQMSLVGQPFIKNPDIKVEQLLSDNKAEVTAFKRFELGEGIEKQVTDFAKEVEDQLKGD